MKPHYRMSLFAVIFISLLLLFAGIASAERNLNSSVLQDAGMPWTNKYVHQVPSPGDVGKDVSLALRPFDDLPYMSYYDEVDGNLILAHFVPNGTGNCGTNNNWDCEVMDGASGDDVGKYSSLDFWSDDATHTWRIGISYYDGTNQALKYLTWTCTQMTCTIKKIYTIYDAPLVWIAAGLHSSFKFNPDGEPIIAYFVSNSLAEDSLQLAYYVDSGGNCGEDPDVGEWQCDIIDVGEDAGLYASLDLTYDGTIYIAYYDGAIGAVRLANFWGIIVDDCYDDNGWACPIIDGTGDTGYYTSLVMQRFPGDKMYRIAYYNATTGNLMYSDSEWDSLIVDEMGTSPTAMDISMNLDGDGNPIIAYQQISSEYSPPALMIARPYTAYDDGLFGNCGDVPPDYLFLYWRCDVVDDGGQYLEEAGFISVAVKATGLPIIAYSEFYNFDAGDHSRSVKIAYQYYQSVLPLLSKP